ncbi:MAG: hypothetical protein JWM16_3803 [Verrucomicrobiales bacterium]|nr:hypothetical protein [Verrucomicrobiales bacterium]
MKIWTHLAISVALLGVFCILSSELIERDGFYDSNRQRIAAAMSAVGTVLFAVGRVVNHKRALRIAADQKSHPASDEEDLETSNEPFLFANLVFWGSMLFAFALVILFVPAKAPPVMPVAARFQEPAKKQEAPPLLTNAATARVVTRSNVVVFPSVKLQGTTQRGGYSSAILNGKTYFLGESVGSAKLISIFETSIVLELGGEFQTVKLGN